MRRIILAIVSTAAALVFLLTFKTHSSSVVTPPAAVGTPGGASAGGGSGQGGSGTASGARTSSGATPAPSSTGSGATPAPSSTGGSSTTSAKTVTGDPADTMYGPVQVQITVKNGKLTGVDAIEYPTGTPRDEQINAYAIPQLTQEALTAGSAKIDAVSGASYTSQGYITSLQSALDKADI